MKNKLLLYGFAGIVIFGIFYYASMEYKKSQVKKVSYIAKTEEQRFVRDHSPRLGIPTAKIVLTEFLDPECESCRAIHPKIKDLLKRYDGQILLVVRYAPFHKNSQNAVRALEAARMQGKYWEALDLLFEYQPMWGDHHNPKPELIFQILPELGLDMTKLREDMKSEKITEIIRQDMIDLQILGVRGTPTFFVNGKQPERFGLQYLEALIQRELSL
ncbi:MAG: DsbA family protein [Bdellovibrionales bacterium]